MIFIKNINNQAINPNS
jgi:hypothetical protein